MESSKSTELPEYYENIVVKTINFGVRQTWVRSSALLPMSSVILVKFLISLSLSFFNFEWDDKVNWLIELLLGLMDTKPFTYPGASYVLNYC